MTFRFSWSSSLSYISAILSCSIVFANCSRKAGLFDIKRLIRTIFSASVSIFFSWKCSYEQSAIEVKTKVPQLITKLFYISITDNLSMSNILCKIWIFHIVGRKPKGFSRNGSYPTPSSRMLVLGRQLAGRMGASGWSLPVSWLRCFPARPWLYIVGHMKIPTPTSTFYIFFIFFFSKYNFSRGRDFFDLYHNALSGRVGVPCLHWKHARQPPPYSHVKHALKSNI